MRTSFLRFWLSIGVVLLIGSTSGVLAQNGGTVNFTNLSEGDTVSSLRTLKGTITFPDFVKYEIFLKTGDNLIWAANAHSPVENGNLARLDPRVFNDGQYQVIVRQVHSDSNYTDVMGPTITIDNPNDGAAPYYPEVPPSMLYPSDKFAIVRAINCTGEDFFFDYTSPQDFASAGEVTLSPHQPGLICPFTDLAVVPAEYRGTAKGGAQTEGVPLEFLAEAGKVYHLNYNGPSAGGNQIVVTVVEPDDRTAEMDAATPEKATVTPKPAVTNTSVSATPTPAETAESDPMLPVSGNDPGDANTPYTLIAGLVIVALLAGGVLAVWQRRTTA